MVIGADLALNHGALVDVTGTVLHQYTDGDGMLSGPGQLYKLACAVSRATPKFSTVIIDWDRDQGNWRSPTIGVLMTMLAAMYGTLAQTARLCKVRYVPPHDIRTCLILPATASKEAVHEQFRLLYEVPTFETDYKGDCFDAYILAYTWQCTQTRFSY